MNIRKINDFLYNTFQVEYIPFKHLNTRHLNSKGLAVCIYCPKDCYDKSEDTVKSIRNFEFISEVIVNEQYSSILFPHDRGYRIENGVTYLDTEPIPVQESREYSRSKVTKADYVLYLNAGDKIEGLRDLYVTHLSNPDKVVTTSNICFETLYDVLFGIDRAVILPKTLKWVNTKAFSSCASVFGYSLSRCSTSKLVGNAENIIDKHIFDYLNYISMCFPLLRHFKHSIAPFKKYFLNQYCKYLGK